MRTHLSLLRPDYAAAHDLSPASRPAGEQGSRLQSVKCPGSHALAEDQQVLPPILVAA